MYITGVKKAELPGHRVKKKTGKLCLFGTLKVRYHFQNLA